MWKPYLLAALIAAACASPALGYGGDTHYYLRFASALETCFTWDEAHLIASADYLVDKNRTTTAEKQPFKKFNKVNWHAFSRDPERFNVLWERVLAEKDEELQLVKLGQFLHFATDWESHYGYGVRMGHAVPTLFARDPDSLGNNELNNLRMIGQTIYHMLELCSVRGRAVEGELDPDKIMVRIFVELQGEPIMDTLFQTNTPRWKKWGKRWKMGKQILAQNHLLVEELIDRRGAQYPDRDIPADFTPGDLENGLPPPIGVRYDKNGELAAILGVEMELLPEYSGNEATLAELERLEEEVFETELVDDLEELVQDGKDLDLYVNVELRLEDADLTDEGWSVRVEVDNLASRASETGALEMYVLDVSTEETLGTVTWEIPALRGGETFAGNILIEADGEPTRGIVIGATLIVNDLSADNNDVWFIPWRNAVASEERKKKKKTEKQGRGQVEFLGKPKMWVDGNDDGWLMIKAFVDGGDSARRLGEITIRFNEDTVEVAEMKNYWFSVPDRKRRLVPARAGIWLPTIESACDSLADGVIEIEITVAGKGAEPAMKTFQLEPDFIEAYGAACRRSR